MFRFIFLITFSLSATLSAQTYQSLDTIKAPSIYENIYLRPLYSDSLVSSFVIFVKKEVKTHKHALHSESIYILEGEGSMLIGKEKKKIKKGDFIFVPKGTIHALAVTSAEPVKVISIQAPYFDGTDRIPVELKNEPYSGSENK